MDFLEILQAWERANVHANIVGKFFEGFCKKNGKDFSNLGGFLGNYGHKSIVRYACFMKACKKFAIFDIFVEMGSSLVIC